MKHFYESENRLRLNSVLIFFLYCAILFVVYARFFFADQLPMSGDAINWITDLTLVKHALAKGELPFWNKYLLGGIPFAPNYTPIMLLGFLPVKLMIYTLYIGIVAWGAASADSYFRKIGCTPWAAFAVSLCYLLSIHLGGYRKSHTLLVFTISLLPVILNFVERYFAERKLCWLLASSAVMALQFCIGFPQQVIYTDFFVAAYLIAFGLHYRMKIKQMLLHGLAWVGAYFGLIAWKLLPMMEQTSVYIESGAEGTIDFGLFRSFSIHVAKLIQTIFPRVFGANNYLQAFTAMVSSEMDIELFLGHMFVLLFFAGAIYLADNFRVRFALASMAVSLLYAASGTIPKLAGILYHIPLLNGFRVPSRALFLFIFSAYTIITLTLSEMREDAFRKRVFRLACIISCTVLFITASAVFAAVIVTGVQNGFTVESFSALEGYVKECLFADCIGLAFCLLILWIAAKPPKKLNLYVYRFACGAIAAFTLCETLPYTVATQPADVASLQAVDPISAMMKQEIGNGKVWDAFAGIDGTHESIISLNRATSKEIPALNAYITFNNPRLYRILTQSVAAPLNSSGLLTGTLKADQIVHLQNSLLSMLGVKYIVDSSGLLTKDAVSYMLRQEKRMIASREMIELPYLPDSVSMYYELFQPTPYTYYEFNATCISDTEQAIYFDFYGGAEYDSPEQEVTFELAPGENQLSGIVYSGDLTGAQPDGTYWRVISLADEPLSLTDVSLSKVTALGDRDTYRYWSDGEGVPVYLNTKARDILYVPDRFEWIADEEDLYRNTWLYQLDHVNYTSTGYEWPLAPDAVVIRDVDFGYNRIEAHISSPDTTFVNFSQCWYPGWHAYVNGVETPVEIVNGLIMGAEVPAGETELRFAYKPKNFYYGAVVSAISACAVIFAFALKRHKEKTAHYQELSENTGTEESDENRG